MNYTNKEDKEQLRKQKEALKKKQQEDLKKQNAANKRKNVSLDEAIKIGNQKLNEYYHRNDSKKNSKVNTLDPKKEARQAEQTLGMVNSFSASTKPKGSDFDITDLNTPTIQPKETPKPKKDYSKYAKYGYRGASLQELIRESNKDVEEETGVKGTTMWTEMSARHGIDTYYKGLSSMSDPVREDWEKKHAKLLQGKSDEQKDRILRNTIFKELFSTSEDPQEQALYENRYNLSAATRDIAVSKKLMSLYGNEEDWQYHPTKKKVYNEARMFLTDQIEEASKKYVTKIMSLDSDVRDQLFEEADRISENSSYYKKYKDTDKLFGDALQKAEVIAGLQAAQDLGLDDFAGTWLNDHFQNMVASRQSLLEKAGNSGMQFVNSMGSFLFTGLGMIGGIGQYLATGDASRLIDNDVVRWADNIGTTGSWNVERQNELKELGLSDYAILNTVEQENSYISLNTPFELFGQYGFTTATTLASLGGTSYLKGVMNLGKAMRGLHATEKGLKTLEKLKRINNGIDLVVTGGVGTVEGAMNAIHTKDDVLQANLSKIDAKYKKRINSEIEQQVRQDPAGARAMLMAMGVEIPDQSYSKSGEGGMQASYSKEEVRTLVELCQNNPTIVERFLANYQTEMEVDKSRAEKDANTAMWMDFTVNSFINGFLNTTLKSTLHSKKIQKSLRKFGLGSPKPSSEGVDILTEGRKATAVAKKYTKAQAVLRKSREAMGEALEEYQQNLSSTFGQAYGTTSFENYITNKYDPNGGIVAAVEDMADCLQVALATTGEAAFSKDALKEGLYGGLSTFMGGPNANFNMGRGNTWRSKIPITWNSGLSPLFSNEVEEVNMSRTKEAERLNAMFANKEVQDLFLGVSGITNWGALEREGTETGNEKEARDAKLGTSITYINSLLAQEGTGYYDMVMNSIAQRMALDKKNLSNPESAEAKAVEEYKQDIANKDSQISDEEALDRVVENATKLNSLIEQVRTETAKVKSIYGEHMDKDVVDGLVYHRIVTKDAKRRLDSLNKEIEAIKTEVGEQSAENSGMSEDEAHIVSMHGSIRRAKTYIEEGQQAIKNLEGLKKELEADKKKALSEGDRQLNALQQALISRQIQEHKDSIKRTKNILDRIEKEAASETSEANSEDKVLSASEILSLDARDRARMLDPKRRQTYSQKQLDEIDKVLSVGNEKYDNFKSKILDAGKLQQAYKEGLVMQFEMMDKPQAFTEIAQVLKNQFATRIKERELQYLLNTKDAATLNKELERLKNTRPQEYEIARRLFMKGTEEQKAAFKAFDDKYSVAQDIATYAHKENPLWSTLTDKEKQAIKDVFNFAISNNINPENVDDVIDALLKTEDNGRYALANFINQRTESSKNISKKKLNAIINQYKEIVGGYSQYKQKKAANSKPVEVTPTAESQAAPAPPVNTNEEFQEGEYVIVTGEPVIGEGENVINPKVQELMTELLKYVESLRSLPTYYGSQAVSRAGEILSRIELGGLSMEDVSDKILATANTLLQNSDIDDFEERKIVVNVLKRIGTRAKQLAEKKASAEENSDEAPSSRNTQYDEQRAAENENRGIPGIGNADAAVMASSSINYLLVNHPDNPIVKYWKAHGMLDFLKSGYLEQHKNAPVYFISDADLAEELKEYMESSGVAYSNEDIPVIAIVEYENGDITIDGKNYQVIATMPSTNSKDLTGTNTRRGVARVQKIRGSIDKNNPSSLIKDAQGNPLTGTVARVYSNYPERPKDRHHTDTRDLARNTLSNSEKEILDSKEGQADSIYKRIKNAFLAKVKFLKEGEQGARSNGWHYMITSLKGDNVAQPYLVLIKKFSETIGRTGKSILELFNSNDINGLKSANSKTEKAFDILQKFGEALRGASLDGYGIEKVVENGETRLIPNESFAEFLNEQASNLTKNLGRILSLPDPSNSKYSIELAENEGELVFRVFAEAQGNKVFVADIFKNSDTHSWGDQEIFNALKNLATDNGEARKSLNKNYEFIKWNIDYPNSSTSAKEMTNIRAGLANAYDDGLLEMSINSIEMTLGHVEINSPFNAQGEPVNRATATGVNTGDPSIAERQVVKENAVIDSDTGTVLEGEPPVSDKPLSGSQQDRIDEENDPLVTRIENDMEGMERPTEDSNYYVLKKKKDSGRHERVHTIMGDNSTSKISEQGELNGNRATTAGTEVDAIVRSFFEGTDPSNIKYNKDIISEEAFKLLIDYLNDIKKGFEERHEKVFANNLVIGHNFNGLKVAGELDIITVDDKGVYRIYDLKTSKDDFFGSKYKTRQSWQKRSTKAEHTRQLNFYAAILKEEYGIEVKSLSIIPFHVEFKNGLNAIAGETDPVVGITYKGDIPLQCKPTEITNATIDEYHKNNPEGPQGVGENTPIGNSEPTSNSSEEAQLDTDDLNNFDDAFFELRTKENENEEKWNDETRQRELDRLAKILPNSTEAGRIRLLEKIEEIAGKGNPEAWGSYLNGVISLYKNAIRGTAYHEAFHEVIDALLTKEEQSELFDMASEEFGDKPAKELEEDLAEGFRKYSLKRDDSSLSQRLINFFKDLRADLRALVNARKSLEDIYSRVYRGKYKTRDFNPRNNIARYSTSYTKEMLDIKNAAIADGTFMKAPNGQDSHLTEKQWLQVRTKAFKDWFGDWQNDPANSSKIVDENGEPLVVYHGGKAGIKAFDLLYTRRNKLGEGFYFTPNKSLAESYKNENNDGDVYEVFLNLKKEDKRPQTKYDDWGSDDGVINGYHSYDAEEIVVRRPNQIKSATDNIGTFDNNNDDIRYSLVTKEQHENSYKYVHPMYRWGQFKDFKTSDGQTLDIAATMEMLSKFYTEEEWNDLTDIERDHELNCKGVC